MSAWQVPVHIRGSVLSSCQKCRMNNSSDFYKTALIVDSGTNGASFLVCMVAAVMVFVYKLHRKTVYRLALYQVFTALAMAAIHVSQAAIIKYREELDLCKAFAYLSLFVEWMKLLLSAWVTLHLFCFAVFYRNLRRCELVYLVTSLVVPAVIASVPFTTHSYGLAGSWCWIQSRQVDVSNTSTGTIEQFVLWYGPSMFLLFTCSIAMTLMMCVLQRRLCRRRLDAGGRLCYKDEHWKAFKQLLPLAAYPIVYFIFNILPFIYRVYRAIVSHHRSAVHDTLEILSAITTSAWCLAAGLTLIVHILMTQLSIFGRKRKYVKVDLWT